MSNGDLKVALKLLSDELQISESASEELLALLEQVDRSPRASVLYPENCDTSLPITMKGNFRQAWLVVKRVYTTSFAFIVVETMNRNRAIVKVFVLSRG